MELIQQIISKIDKGVPTCWLWLGNKTINGYGQITFKNKHYLTHRVSYEYFKGNIPNTLQIDHLCKNRSCVNPEHLEVVTQKENLKRGNTGKHNNHVNTQINKTHCPQGHEYSGKNNLGRRICKICNKNTKIKYNLKQRKQKNG